MLLLKLLCEFAVDKRCDWVYHHNTDFCLGGMIISFIIVKSIAAALALIMSMTAFAACSSDSGGESHITAGMTETETETEAETAIARSILSICLTASDGNSA